jgi:hypothetical protein
MKKIETPIIMNTEKDIFLVPQASLSFPFELPLRRNGYFLIHPASIEEFSEKCEKNNKQFYVELNRKGIKARILKSGYTLLSLITVE